MRERLLWSAADDEWLAAQVKAGVPYRDIARQKGVSKTHVGRRAAALRPVMAAAPSRGPLPAYHPISWGAIVSHVALHARIHAAAASRRAQRQRGA